MIEILTRSSYRALCTSVAHTFSQIFAIRWFLGIFESAVLPSVVRAGFSPRVMDITTIEQVFYLSTFYKRNELASRVGLFYGSVLY